MDSKGNTKIHSPSCPNFGSHSKRKCRCPTRLAAGTVNSTIGKLRAIFNSVGRTGDWSGLSPGNPAAHPSVKKYLISISEEQAKARASPRQAVPFFFDKFTKLCTYLRHRLFVSSVSPVYTKEVLLLPEDQGLSLFHQTFEKTLRGKDSKNQFAVRGVPRTLWFALL